MCFFTSTSNIVTSSLHVVTYLQVYPDTTRKPVFGTEPQHLSGTQATFICGSDIFVARPIVTWVRTSKWEFYWSQAVTGVCSCNWGVRTIIWPSADCSLCQKIQYLCQQIQALAQSRPGPCVSHTCVHCQQELEGRGEREQPMNKHTKLEDVNSRSINFWSTKFHWVSQ